MGQPGLLRKTPSHGKSQSTAPATSPSGSYTSATENADPSRPARWVSATASPSNNLALARSRSRAPDGRRDCMKRSSVICIALVAMVESVVVVSTAEASGTHRRPGQAKFQSYQYTEAGKTIRLTIPEGLAVVRGILVVW